MNNTTIFWIEKGVDNALVGQMPIAPECVALAGCDLLDEITIGQCDALEFPQSEMHP